MLIFYNLFHRRLGPLAIDSDEMTPFDFQLSAQILSHVKPQLNSPNITCDMMVYARDASSVAQEPIWLFGSFYI